MTTSAHLLLFTLVPRHRCLCPSLFVQIPPITQGLNLIRKFSHLSQPLFTSLPRLVMLNCLVFSSHLRFPELSLVSTALPGPLPGRADHPFYLCLLISQDNVNPPHFGFCLFLFTRALLLDSPVASTLPSGHLLVFILLDLQTYLTKLTTFSSLNPLFSWMPQHQALLLLLALDTPTQSFFFNRSLVFYLTKAPA